MARPARPITLRVKRDSREFLPDELLPLADYANRLMDRVLRFWAMGKRRPDFPDYVPLKRKYLEDELGWRVVGKLLRWLLDNSYLRRTPNYFEGKDAYGFRIGPALDGLPTRDLVMTNPNLIRKIRALQKGKEKAWCKERKHLKFWANRIGIDLGEMTAIVQTLPSKAHGSAVECLAAIVRGDTFHGFCEYGRAHTAVTRLHKTLRPCLTFLGRKLVAIDVKNSQPLILGATLLREIRTGVYRPQTRTAKKHARAALRLALRQDQQVQGDLCEHSSLKIGLACAAPGRTLPRLRPVPAPQRPGQPAAAPRVAPPYDPPSHQETSATLCNHRS